MNWADPIYRYCERGQDAAFWAEPLNALSNVAYLLAACAAAALLVRERREAAQPGPAALQGTVPMIALILLAATIGVGSFLFHTVATRWARLADVIPIGVFMVGYLVYALRTFLGLRAMQVAGLAVLFLAITAVAASISCPLKGASLVTYAREPCLKGSLGYIPALAALLLVAVLVHRRHAVARPLLMAAGAFGAAIMLRWLDTRACPFTMLLGKARGTHAGWHVLTALTLYLLLAAAIRDAVRGSYRPAA